VRPRFDLCVRAIACSRRQCAFLASRGRRSSPLFLLIFKPLRAASGRPFPDDDHTRAAGKALIVGPRDNQEKPMTKIIAFRELRYHTLAELEALFRTLQIELGRTAPGSRERAIVLASLDSVRRAMAARHDRQPKP
jgi:hypothetical protein